MQKAEGGRRTLNHTFPAPWEWTPQRRRVGKFLRNRQHHCVLPELKSTGKAYNRMALLPIVFSRRGESIEIGKLEKTKWKQGKITVHQPERGPGALLHLVNDGLLELIGPDNSMDSAYLQCQTAGKERCRVQYWAWSITSALLCTSRSMEEREEELQTRRPLIYHKEEEEKGSPRQPEGRATGNKGPGSNHHLWHLNTWPLVSAVWGGVASLRELCPWRQA